MSDEQQGEQKYGLEGIEQSQGYSPLVHAVPDEPAEPAIDTDSASYRHLTRPAPPPPVERSYNDVNTGEPTPDNQTVELERSSRDLTAIREEERREVERARNEALNRELDDATATLDAIRAAEAPQPQQPYQPELDPAAIAAMPYEQQLALGEANQAQLAEADKQIQALLQDPVVRERIETEFNQVRAQVDVAKQQYQAATEQLVLESQGIITALYPELAGLDAAGMRGALQVMARNQPERVQQLAQLNARAQNLIGVYQNQQAEQRQQFAQQVAQHQRDSAQRFQLFATAADNAFDEVNKSVPAETMKAIRQEAVAIFKEHGVSETELAQLYNSNELLRSAAGQQIVAEAARWRLAQKAISQHRSAPVPRVQRPGVSEPVRIDDGAVSAALQRLNSPGGNEGRAGLRNAAALVAARRGNR
jgi:hypothetical protein